MNRALIYCALMISASLFPTAVENASAQSMKLLAPGVGWLATDKSLFWTMDDGQHWRDITPRINNPQHLASVYFLDKSVGWVLITHSSARFVGEAAPDVTLASTSDSGSSWTFSSVEFPGDLSSLVLQNLTGRGWLNFVDANHGWIILKGASGSAYSWGILLGTSDGGHTWFHPLGDLPIADHMSFLDTKRGWIAGGPNGDELYMTPDGGTTWTIVSVLTPEQVELFPDIAYGIPTFIDRSTGFLTVTYAPPNSLDVTLALFRTTDGGRTWSADRVVPNLPHLYNTAPIPSASEDTSLLVGYLQPSLGAITVSKVSGDGKLTASATATLGDESAVTDISFINDSRGWVLTSIGGLFSTKDSAHTWSSISPVETPESRTTWLSQKTPSSGKGISPLTSSRVGPPIVDYVSTHLGFDISKAPPYSPQMKAWWNASPYYDIGVYLLNAPNRTGNPNLNANWVNQVEKQGWGIIPIWNGPQAPKTAAGKQCSIEPQKQRSFFSLKNPESQGEAQAAAAIASASAPGPTGTALPPGIIIYYDMENYNTGNPACSQAVVQFLQGWVNGMAAANYKAGVYGNVAPAEQDFSQLDPSPDDVWITLAPPGPGYPPEIATWGLSTSNVSLDDDIWINNQRMHQFLLDQPGVTFGSYPLAIDDDIDNGELTGGDGTKPYVYSTYVPLNFNNSSDYSTFPTAISDMSSPGQIINGPNQTGTIVGYFTNDLALNLFHGFLLQNGQWTQLDYTDENGTAASTVPLGINNSGEIVGIYYRTTTSVAQPFTYILGAYATLCATEYGSWLYGVNDAQQLVGFGCGSTASGGIFYYDGTPYDTAVTSLGLNGDAYISGAGEYEYLQPPNWSGNVITFAGGYTTGINNDNDQTYWTINPETGNYQSFLLRSSGASTPILPTTPSVYANAVNDFGQVVGQLYEDGCYVCFTGGFIAIPAAPKQ